MSLAAYEPHPTTQTTVFTHEVLALIAASRLRHQESRSGEKNATIRPSPNENIWDPNGGK